MIFPKEIHEEDMEDSYKEWALLGYSSELVDMGEIEGEDLVIWVKQWDEDLEDYDFIATYSKSRSGTVWVRVQEGTEIP